VPEGVTVHFTVPATLTSSPVRLVVRDEGTGAMGTAEMAPLAVKTAAVKP
jgi:hypothetical protein